jgi:hypothetical protein
MDSLTVNPVVEYLEVFVDSVDGDDANAGTFDGCVVRKRGPRAALREQRVDRGAAHVRAHIYHYSFSS